MASLETKSFSNIITFTRASRATYFDSTGIIKSATTNTPRFDYNPVTLALRGILVEEQRTNRLTYSEDFNNSAWIKSNSSITLNTTTSPSGALNADTITEDTATNQHLVYQAISSVSSGTTYTFSCFVKQGSGTRKVFLTAFGEGYSVFDPTTGSVVQTGGNVCTATNVGNGWWRFSAAITKTNTTANFYIGIWSTTNSYTGDGTSSLFIWGAQVEVGAFATSYTPSSVTFSGRTSTATYFDYTGTLRTALSGEARISYNPSNLSADPFLLLEESRTNSIRNNMMAGAVAGTPGTAPTGWIAGVNGSGLTIQLVGTGTENGIAYVDYRFSGTTSSATEFFVQPVTGTTVAATNGQTWTGSFYVRAVAGSIANINNARVITRGVNSSAALTIGTGSDVKDSLNVSSINLLRPTTTVTTADAATTAVQTYFGCSHGSGVAIDITLRVGMPQLELGAGATSVIPTSSVAVTRSADTSSSATATRSADVASINTLDPWYNNLEGTFYAEAVTLKPSGSAPIVVAQVSGGADRHQVSIYTNVTATLVDNSIQSSIGTNTSQSIKIAYGYKLNDFAVSVNGGAVATDTSGNIPTNLTYLTIGKFDFGGAESLTGHISKLAYYPRRLTNAELQALTT